MRSVIIGLTLILAGVLINFATPRADAAPEARRRGPAPRRATPARKAPEPAPQAMPEPEPEEEEPAE
ncbi:hypothetical protein NL533_30255, partial [Klebsiella pneumoniae]|nr:hypothetical protein [Klebsiella pneumoniae]